MKANRRSRGRPDDQGVSAVIGAILVTGLVFSLLLTIRLSFVPVWEKNAEQAHLINVERQLSTIKSELDRQVDNRTANALTNSLTLVPERVSIFQGAPAAHRVAFNTSGHDARFSSTLLLVLVNNGASISGLNPDWDIVQGSLNDVESVEHLRVKFNLSKGVEGSILMSIQDVNGAAVGHLEIEISKSPPDRDIHVRTFQAGNPNPIAATTNTVFGVASVPDYFVDALDPSLLFDQLLASAEPPFTVQLTQDPGLDAQYTAAYNQATGTGTVLVGNTGVSRPNYNATYAAGSLVYSAFSPHGVDQTYVLENGALVLTQPDGSVFRIPPSFSVVRTGGVTALTLALPSLRGAASSISGLSNVKVTTTSFVGADMRAVAPDFRLRVNTSFPELWAQYWEDQFQAAQLTSPNDYNVTHDATSATFTLFGTNVDPTRNDISIRLKQASVAVTLAG